jgi:hypothetical protein
MRLVSYLGEQADANPKDNYNEKQSSLPAHNNSSLPTTAPLFDRADVVVAGTGVASAER